MAFKALALKIEAATKAAFIELVEKALAKMIVELNDTPYKAEYLEWIETTKD